MVLICDKCRKNVSPRTPMLICAGECKKTFHFACAGISSAEKEARQQFPSLSRIYTKCSSSSLNPSPIASTSSCQIKTDKINFHN